MTASRRPILLALLLAAVTTAGVLVFVRLSQGESGPRAAVGEAAPPIAGTTLDGEAFDLASFRGHPVVVNFWGPSCVPCRDEFPLLAQKLGEHADDGLVVVGVLTDDPPEPARDFVTDYGATWPTVLDPDKAVKTAYRVAARPQTYFVDGTGVIRSIQVGELTDVDFERQFDRISP
jgi:cytochrome c biogenesis protein CcmG/thiol:disulfide interchange protein DsbE